MPKRPGETKTRYARNKEGSYIAYQVFGEGSLDIVFIPDWVTNLEVMWEEPTLARFLSRLAAIGRVICFDKRGTGVSDPVPLGAIPTFEEWMDDVGCVLDAVGSPRAALLGHGDGAPMAILFAATHPDRTSALVLADAYARRSRATDYHCGVPSRTADTLIEMVLGNWGTGDGTVDGAPSMADNLSLREWRGRYERLAMSPGVFNAVYPNTLQLDVRPALETIRVPTLVLHRAENRYIRVDNGRYLAQHIDGATFIELPGADHFFHCGDTDAFLGAVQEFLTGAKRLPDDDRVLATVLFTDIVGATEQAERSGDRAWRDLLERHHSRVRQELERFRGREIDTAGDGFFATFDGPARGVRCALAIRDAVRSLGIEIRAGLHTGECELLGDKVAGIAVHIGARVMGIGDAGEVLVSRTVKDLVVGSGLDFTDHGVHTLKGVAGDWELFSAV
jgi:pimeloyl-ACP methyl ester carboxylesterase